MVRTSKDFFDDFNKLMEINALIPDYVPPRLVEYNINGQNIGPEDIVRIVEGIKEGDKEQLLKWGYLKEYLSRTLDLIESMSSWENKENWREIYGWDRDPRREIRVESMEHNIEIIIKRLLYTDFRMNPNKLGSFFQIMKPTERMALESLQRQGIETQNKKRMTLPPEMFREIGKFVGRSKGGQRNRIKTRRKSRCNKRKSIRRK